MGYKYYPGAIHNWGGETSGTKSKGWIEGFSSIPPPGGMPFGKICDSSYAEFWEIKLVIAIVFSSRAIAILQFINLSPVI